MLLWTILNKEHFDTFAQTGILHNTRSHIHTDFANAYSWMMTQMEKRGLRPPSPTHTPIWCWHTYWNAAKRMPDLRQAALLYKGTNGVRVAFEPYPLQVLYSDFDLWHNVLNKASIAPEEHLERQEDILRKNHAFEDLPDDIRLKIEQTWEKIFDLEWQDDDWTFKNGEKRIQGCFWELRWEQVRDVKMFIAR